MPYGKQLNKCFFLNLNKFHYKSSSIIFLCRDMHAMKRKYTNCQNVSQSINYIVDVDNIFFKGLSHCCKTLRFSRPPLSFPNCINVSLLYVLDQVWTSFQRKRITNCQNVVEHVDGVPRSNKLLDATNFRFMLFGFI